MTKTQNPKINNKMKKQIRYNSGQAIITAVVFFLFISTTVILGVSAPVYSEVRLTRDVVNSKDSYYLAESGQEDVIYRLKNGITVSSSESLTVGGSTVVTNTVDSFGTKIITSNATSSSLIRRLKTELIIGNGVAFNFGVQAGNGGFIMDNNAGVNGNVYSNGPILGDSGAFITGSAISAESSGLIDDVDVGTTGTDEAWANQVTSTNITGPLYCQTGSGNNKSCDTSRADPASQPFPITDTDIDGWKIDAEAGGVIVGNYNVSGSETLGPVKITGNLNFGNNATLTLNGPIWVVGTIDTANNTVVRVSSSYGTNSEIMLSDDEISLSNNTSFQGSGSAGSYILLLTTSNSLNAIDVSNNAGTVILNAQNGRINFSNNSGANQATADTIFLDNNATVTYESGLIDTHFTSGPGGGYNINSWKEIE